MVTIDAVSAYCSRCGLDDVRFDERQRIDLNVDDREMSFCLIDRGSPVLWIGCTIGDVDPDDRDAQSWLLSVGLYPWVLRGERIGLIPDTTTAILFTVLPVQFVTYEALTPIVDGLIGTSADLAAKLRSRDFTVKLN